jgi:predicted Fe-S protein YdhL (DUF1289 family)
VGSQQSEYVCHACGVVGQAHCASCQQWAEDYASLDEALKKERRKVTTLTRQLADVRQESPHMSAAERIFERWIVATGRNPQRVTFTDDRKDAVLKMLKQLSKRRKGEDARAAGERAERTIVAAVLFVASHPYQLFAKHVAEPHRSATKRDDLAYVCAKGSRVEEWAERWEAGQHPANTV